GPNGAGKSTLVKIMMTVIRPTTCVGTMLGQPVGNKSALRRVGYLPEHHKFPDYLTAAQVLDYFGALADVPRADRKKRSRELLGLVGIDKWANHKVKGFSKGMRQRLGIANALMNDPELVVLDEPTDGVDPVGRRDIRNVLTAIRDQGRTVLLNSHLLSELEMVCDRVAILVQGRVSSLGTIDELTRDSRRYEIEANGPDEALAGVARAALASGPTIGVEGPLLRVGTDDPEAVQPIIDALRRAGVTIRAVRPVRESLEDLFMKAVTDQATGQVLKPGAAEGKS
ncbi:MAG: ABC transporter ATP-binding protein, partial [Phycisphaerales bacterium]|nr:ABC transporter ATP-binding protein [Phycisphaerales bacterium]